MSTVRGERLNNKAASETTPEAAGALVELTGEPLCGCC